MWKKFDFSPVCELHHEAVVSQRATHLQKQSVHINQKGYGTSPVKIWQVYGQPATNCNSLFLRFITTTKVV